ncbi:MAG: PhoH family protein [Clostridia bacterium]|nr:PhoH family protein [Clostridia bacterium]
MKEDISGRVYKKSINIGSAAYLTDLFGSCDKNIRMLEDSFNVRIALASGSENTDDPSLLISGNDEKSVSGAAEAVGVLCRIIAEKGILTEQTLIYVTDMIKEGKGGELSGYDSDCICVSSRGRPIHPKTVGQKKYVELIKKNTIVLGTGPAGTGKTFLAVAMAVKALRDKQVNRIILTRPAIEAGEKLGFLPGDLQSKIDPYLRPLYDALGDLMGPENYQRAVEKQVVEVAPLAYMRGRTLDDSFIILDEAQNATFEQMKMFLTRLGNNSKAVVTGDLTQTDLPYGQKSGLWSAVKILDGIEDIAIHRFSEKDVVRHKLVQKIILAYDKYEKENREKDESRQHYGSKYRKI